MKLKDFGIADYKEIWADQRYHHSMLIDHKLQRKPSPVLPEMEWLLIGEHSDVYTLGFHGNAANLLVSEETLRDVGVECIRIERGGDITYHGPGQLIAYPIIDLDSHALGVKAYVSLLETSVIELLKIYGIIGYTIEGATGIWVEGKDGISRKICAIGIKVRRGCTMHGLALNVSTDLTKFHRINPCGFTDKGVTSLQHELADRWDDMRINIKKVKNDFVSLFTEIINGRKP